MSILQNARGFVMNVNGNLVDNGQKHKHKIGSGLKILHKASYPEASHDSSSHPTSCFPGTRTQYIEDIAAWGRTPITERHFGMLWMEGPAGVGKTSVVQSCTRNVGEKLAAAFFFSRPDNRNDSKRLFPSIAYQLTTKHPTYRDKLDEKIFYDVNLVNKSIDVQFEELIVAPLRELQSVDEGVVFIDGLDECAGEDVQCAIIDIISTSVRDRTTPFIWVFSSRPEPRLVARFGAPHMHGLCQKLTLHVSHDADGDVERYLEDGFGQIRAQNGLLSRSWPSMGDIREVVRRSKGLFLYPTSVIRFVGEGGPQGPEEQLRLVLKHPSELTINPWSHLDVFYTLIMEEIPVDILVNTLKLLSLACIVYDGQKYARVAEILNLPSSTYCAALIKLHSVAKLTCTADGSPIELEFYHTSFTDFLENPKRSGRFCIKGPEICASLLADVIKSFHEGGNRRIARLAFWELGSYAKLDKDLLQQLSAFNFRNMSISSQLNFVNAVDVERFLNNIPLKWQKKIMRRYSLSLRNKMFPGKEPMNATFTLGQGNRKCRLALSSDGGKYYFPLNPLAIEPYIRDSYTMGPVEPSMIDSSYNRTI